MKAGDIVVAVDDEYPLTDTRGIYMVTGEGFSDVHNSYMHITILVHPVTRFEGLTFQVNRMHFAPAPEEMREAISFIKNVRKIR